MASWVETALILFVNLLISFAAGCATHRESYVRALKTPQAMVICLITQFGVRPAIVFGLMVALSVPDHTAVGCLLCAMAPGGNGSNLLEIIFRGNIELGIVCTLCSSLFASVAIPLDFFLYAKRFSEKKFTFVTMPWDDISSAIACVVAGAVAGAILRYHNDRLGEILEHRTAAVGLLLLVAAVVLALVQNLGALHIIPWSAWVATIFPCPCGLLFSYYPARFSGMSTLDARTVATEVGECNIGVAYAILLLLYKDEDDRREVFSGIVAYTVFNEIYIFGAAFYWRFVDPIVPNNDDASSSEPASTASLKISRSTTTTTTTTGGCGAQKDEEQSALSGGAMTNDANLPALGESTTDIELFFRHGTTDEVPPTDTTTVPPQHGDSALCSRTEDEPSELGSFTSSTTALSGSACSNTPTHLFE
ncbi:hypothetical protein CTAYLR_002297 [Chrysophaeum taylorii]|uniref:Sodium/bile acid cotransporter n=1 Tax=Chrysophaeum taylorii TaxID=2483200 RepID=A0AAD7XU64_9STRA|nr:hypothetical protein CTAYLR_002297 [Chrysophaeum taylorii]